MAINDYDAMESYRNYTGDYPTEEEIAKAEKINIRDTHSRFKTLSSKELYDIRSDTKNRLESTLRALDDILDKMITSECRVCGKTAEGYNSLPKGWGWRAGFKLCEKHLRRYDEIDRLPTRLGFRRYPRS